jgi:hypothetical protein
MKPILSSVCLVGVLFACVFSGPLRAAEDISATETLGTLALDWRQDEVIKLLGQPASKGKDVNWDAIGKWVQEWKFPDRGIVLHMASGKRGGKKTVLSITASPGCTLATARGIRIGSTEAAVRKAYGPLEDKEQSVAGKSFVAGSVYGGVIFLFDGGKVSEIFIGAAAE